MNVNFIKQKGKLAISCFLEEEFEAKLL